MRAMCNLAVLIDIYVSEMHLLELIPLLVVFSYGR